MVKLWLGYFGVEDIRNLATSPLWHSLIIHSGMSYKVLGETMTDLRYFFSEGDLCIFEYDLTGIRRFCFNNVGSIQCIQSTMVCKALALTKHNTKESI